MYHAATQFLSRWFRLPCTWYRKFIAVVFFLMQRPSIWHPTRLCFDNFENRQKCTLRPFSRNPPKYYKSDKVTFATNSKYCYRKQGRHKALFFGTGTISEFSEFGLAGTIIQVVTIIQHTGVYMCVFLCLFVNFLKKNIINVILCAELLSILIIITPVYLILGLLGKFATSALSSLRGHHLPDARQASRQALKWGGTVRRPRRIARLCLRHLCGWPTALQEAR